ncbi:MAG: ribulose-phosphate 3-epimerase [Planctomycetaceae bacterium]|nr:ribulose-phosphate 3-epimerase [Planctomycetaceae bacterium]
MSRQSTLEQLSQQSPVIAPSMLKCDFGNLAEEVASLDAVGSQVLHWDVMDGHFVPNLSYGALVFAPLREKTNQLFDAHLMISEPAEYLDDYLKAGCDCITIHIEAVPDPTELLLRIREADCVAGLSLNPDTPLEKIAPYLPFCDLVLVMSVKPGFGGQAFIPDSVERIARINELVGPETIIAVDGGIAPETIGECAAAGARLFVTGSSVFNADDYGSAMAEMRAIAESRRTSLSS